MSKLRLLLLLRYVIWLWFVLFVFTVVTSYICFSTCRAVPQIINPGRTIPIALWISIPLIVVLLFLPLVAAAGVNAPVPWQDWEVGQFSVIAQYVVVWCD